jgi:hypothetical protein
VDVRHLLLSAGGYRGICLVSPDDAPAVAHEDNLLSRTKTQHYRTPASLRPSTRNQHTTPQPSTRQTCDTEDSKATRLVTRLPLLTVSPQQALVHFVPFWLPVGIILAGDPLYVRLLQARSDGPRGPADDRLCHDSVHVADLRDHLMK